MARSISNDSRKGLTLVEMVLSVIIMVIVFSMAVFFLATGVQGINISRTASVVNSKAGVALQRISLELRDANGNISVDSGAKTVTYQSSVAAYPGTRTIAYDSGAKTITLSFSGNTYVLTDNVASFTISPIMADVDGNGVSEVGTINMRIEYDTSFSGSSNTTPFVLQVTPRRLN